MTIPNPYIFNMALEIHKKIKYVMYGARLANQ